MKVVRLVDGNAGQLEVRFFRPVQVGAVSEFGDADTTVLVEIESPFFSEKVRASGGDDVTALLGALVVTRGHLFARQREGFQIWWLEPGDLAENAFWGQDLSA